MDGMLLEERTRAMMELEELRERLRRRKGRSQGMEEGGQEEHRIVPKGTPRETPKGTPKGTPTGTPKGTPKGASRPVGAFPSINATPIQRVSSPSSETKSHRSLNQEKNPPNPNPVAFSAGSSPNREAASNKSTSSQKTSENQSPTNQFASPQQSPDKESTLTNASNAEKQGAVDTSSSVLTDVLNTLNETVSFLQQS